MDLPEGSCDSQIHVFGDAADYPPHHPKPLYSPPEGEGLIGEALAIHEKLDIHRLVIVNATIYATDVRLLCDTLRALPSDKARGIAIVDNSVTDRQLADMHDAGVRGARFNFQPRFGLVPDIAEFHRQAARLAEMGWMAKVFCGPAELEAMEGELRKTKINILLDHMGQIAVEGGVAQPAMQRLLNLLAEERFWMMLSNGDHLTHEYPWDEIVPFGHAFYKAAPDRCVWGSDWPHVARWIHPRPKPYTLHPSGFAGKLALGLRYLPDTAAVQKVFADNPARLFRFD